MDRRKFIRQTGITGIMALAAPSLFSAIEADTQTGNIHYYLLSGGVRTEDFMKEWNRFNILKGQTLYTGIRHREKHLTHAHTHEAIYRSISKYAGNRNIRYEFADSGFLHSLKNEKSSYTANGTPAITVHHLEGFDAAHHDPGMYYQAISESISVIRKAYAKQNGQNATFIITTDMGRNSEPNLMGGLDHHTEDARNIFCLEINPRKEHTTLHENSGIYTTDLVGQLIA